MKIKYNTEILHSVSKLAQRILYFIYLDPSFVEQLSKIRLKVNPCFSRSHRLFYYLWESHRLMRWSWFLIFIQVQLNICYVVQYIIIFNLLTIVCVIISSGNINYSRFKLKFSYCFSNYLKQLILALML